MQYPNSGYIYIANTLMWEVHNIQVLFKEQQFQFKETNIPYTFEFFIKGVPHFCNLGEI